MKAIFIIAMVMTQSLLMASGVITVEKQTGQNIAGIIKFFSVENDGRLPKSWEELSSFYDSNKMNRYMQKRYGYNIEDRYQFVDGIMDVPNEKGSQVLLIRVVPLENRRPGLKGEIYRYRYMIVKQANGSIWCSWYTESSVQKMLTKAGITITPPPGVPEVEYDTDPLDYVPPSDDIGGPAERMPQTEKSQNASQQSSKPTLDGVPDNAAPSDTTSAGHGLTVWAILLLIAAGGIWLFVRQRTK